MSRKDATRENMEILGRTGVDRTCVGWRLLEVENPMRSQCAKQPSGPAYTTVSYAPFRGRIYTCIQFLKKHIFFHGHLALGVRVHIQPTTGSRAFARDDGLTALFQGF